MSPGDHAFTSPGAASMYDAEAGYYNERIETTKSFLALLQFFGGQPEKVSHRRLANELDLLANGHPAQFESQTINPGECETHTRAGVTGREARNQLSLVIRPRDQMKKAYRIASVSRIKRRRSAVQFYYVNAVDFVPIPTDKPDRTVTGVTYAASEQIFMSIRRTRNEIAVKHEMLHQIHTGGGERDWPDDARAEFKRCGLDVVS
jgi:hypothetical protein